MILRPYQLDAIQSLRRALSLGKRAPLLVSPTGSGKTVILAEIARLTVQRQRRVLWLAHRTELIEQSAETLSRLGLTTGAICASSSWPPNPFAPVQVASVQTLLARRERPRADVVIVDEAHHAPADEYAALLRDYPDAVVIGATATPERGDGMGLRGQFDCLIVAATIRELTDAGHLVPCRIIRPERALLPNQLAKSPVDAYAEHAAGRRAIVFCKSVPLAEQYAGEFTLSGYPARALSADTPWPERRLMLEAFKRGTLRVLVNVYVLTEGFDDPGVSCCVIARGCGSAGMYLQMIGRILRPASGKQDALLIDLRGVSYEHGEPADERTYSLDGRGISLRDPNSYCPVCGKPPDLCSCERSPEDSMKPDRFMGVRLVPYAHLREDDDPTRAKRLARWITQAREKGYRDGWWKAKFNAVYGHWPTTSLIEHARNRNPPSDPPSASQ